MRRDIKIVGSEKDRTKYISNSDSGFINGMTDFINVSIPASRIAPLKRVCEIFDYVESVPELSWLRMCPDSTRLVSDEVNDKKTFGQSVGVLLSQGQVLTFETPFGPRNLRAKHVYNAVACSLNEDSDFTTGTFYGYAFWTNQAKSAFVCRIFFGTSGLYL